MYILHKQSEVGAGSVLEWHRSFVGVGYEMLPHCGYVGYSVNQENLCSLIFSQVDIQTILKNKHIRT